MLDERTSSRRMRRHLDPVANDLLDLERAVKRSRHRRARELYRQAGETYIDVLDQPAGKGKADRRRLHRAAAQLREARELLVGPPATGSPRKWRGKALVAAAAVAAVIGGAWSVRTSPAPPPAPPPELTDATDEPAPVEIPRVPEAGPGPAVEAPEPAAQPRPGAPQEATPPAEPDQAAAAGAEYSSEPLAQPGPAADDSVSQTAAELPSPHAGAELVSPGPLEPGWAPPVRSATEWSGYNLYEAGWGTNGAVTAGLGHSVVVVTQDGLHLCTTPVCLWPEKVELQDADMVVPPAVALASNGAPTVAYWSWSREYQQGGIRVATCRDPNCFVEPVNVLVAPLDVPGPVDVAVGSGGAPAVVFADPSLTHSHLIRCTIPTCASVTRKAIGSQGAVGFQPSVAMNGDLPIMSHFDTVAQRLKVTRCVDATCRELAAPLAVNIGGPHGTVLTSMHLDGAPATIMWAADGVFGVVRCLNIGCTDVRDSHTVALPGASPGWLNATVTADGRPVAVMADRVTGQRIYLECADATCSSSKLHLLPDEPQWGYPTVTDTAHGPLVAVPGLNGEDLLLAYPPTG